MSDIISPNSPAPTPPLEAPAPTLSPELTLAAPDALATASPPVVAPISPAHKRLEVRVWCSFIFAICAGMFGVGLWLHPNPAGLGSHQQLGLPPCGMYQMTGIPCPTCGCTTAVTYLAHGHPLASLMTQPFGFAVGLVGLILVPLTMIGMATGSWKGPSMFVLGWHWRYWTYGSLTVLLLAWVYKIIIVQMHLG